MDTKRKENHHIPSHVIGPDPALIRIFDQDPFMAGPFGGDSWKQTLLVRALEDGQPSQFTGTVTRWEPSGQGVLGSTDVNVILMWRCGFLFGVGEDHSCDVARMKERFLIEQVSEKLHERGCVREGVEGFEMEDL